MKKFTLLLLLLAGTFFTLHAQQSTRNDIFELLKREGYVPEIDQDGDVKFKIEGTGYIAIVKETDKGYDYVEVAASFSTDHAYDKLLAVSNNLNKNKYLCKCTAYRKEDENVFAVAMEFITDNRESSEFQLTHALRLLPTWVKAFKEKLDEE